VWQPCELLYTCYLLTYLLTYLPAFGSCCLHAVSCCVCVRHDSAGDVEPRQSEVRRLRSTDVFRRCVHSQQRSPNFHRGSIFANYRLNVGGSVAELLACWTQTQKGLSSNRSRAMGMGNILRQTVHTHLASVYQAAKLVAAILRVAWITAGLAESNGSLPPGL